MRRSVQALAVLATTLLTATAWTSAATAAGGSLKLAPLLSGYSRPVLVTHAPGDAGVIYIVEQSGLVKRATFQDGSWRKQGTFLDLRSVVSKDGGERGLLGLAFHPRYRQNGRLYVDYTRAGNGAAEGDTVIAEYRRLDARRADPSSRRVLLTVDQPAANHNGGHLAFGPDGYLYIGLGDGGGAGDPYGTGQDRGSLLGKLLRIDPLDPDGGGRGRYSVPSSNPLVGRAGLDEVWAWGLRNPWRFSFDRATGDLWIGDVGQGDREEVDRSRADGAGRNAGKGANYGWSRCEGSRRYPRTGSACRFGTLPVHDYAHGAGRCSVTGGYVYRGPDAAAWRGLYVAGDYCGRLFVLDASGTVRLSRTTSSQIASFGEDAAGRLFAADVASGTIYEVRPSGPRP
ncbi:MAG TPA: PQQ-dependent sugar dehydrogenase [Candidatus Deferrimicrobium sp.]|nr:PQQ-dependent sugar dehydrogenase [Candidatus Deferrimicrobium sp.]